MCARENMCVSLHSSQVTTGAERTRARTSHHPEKHVATAAAHDHAAHGCSHRRTSVWRTWLWQACVCVGEWERAVEGHRWVLYFKNKTMFAFKKEKKWRSFVSVCFHFWASLSFVRLCVCVCVCVCVCDLNVAPLIICCTAWKGAAHRWSILNTEPGGWQTMWGFVDHIKM